MYLNLLHLLHQFMKLIKIITFLKIEFAKKALKVITNVEILFIRWFCSLFNALLINFLNRCNKCRIIFMTKTLTLELLFIFFKCWKNVVFVKILFDLIQYIKCTYVRIINLKSYENWSKTMPSSLWLKKYTFKLNTLYYNKRFHYYEIHYFQRRLYKADKKR